MTSAEPSGTSARATGFFLDQPATDLPVTAATDDSFAQTMARVSMGSTAPILQQSTECEQVALNSTASGASEGAIVPDEVTATDLENGANQPLRITKEEPEEPASQTLISGAFLSVLPPMLPPVRVITEGQAPNALVIAGSAEMRPTQTIGEAKVELPSAFLASDADDGPVSQSLESCEFSSDDRVDVEGKSSVLARLGADGGGGEGPKVGAKTNQSKTPTANGEGKGHLLPTAQADGVSCKAGSVWLSDARNPTVGEVQLPVADMAISPRPNAAPLQREAEQPVPAQAVVASETADDTAAASPATPNPSVAGRVALPSASAIIGFMPAPERTTRDPGQAPARSSSSDGTDVAQQGSRVKNAAQANKFAAPAEQKLPLGDALVLATTAGATVPRLSNARGLAGLANAKLDLSDAPLPQLSPAISPATEPMDAVASVGPLDVGTAASVRLEKLHSQIVQQVVELKQFGADSMSVVVRPDARTEIVLHLQLDDGVVNVRAQCERGDFGGLNADWGQIQQALARQGIQLGPLREPPAAPPLSGPGIAERLPQPGDGQDSRHHRPSAPDSLDDLPLVGSVTEPLHRRGGRRAVVSGSRWESWA